MKKVLISALVVALALPAPANAGLPTIPFPIPDVCVASCLQFTKSTFYASVQNLIAQIKNLTTMSVGGLASNIASQITTLTQTATATPERSGTAAAEDIMAQAQDAARRQTAIDSAGKSAEGAEQRAQLAAQSASVTNGELIKANVLAASVQKQHQLQDDVTRTFMVNSTANATSANGFE